MLGSQLGHMVTNKELEKFTIVRVDKCVLNQVQADRKVIILLSLTVLVPGNKVNEKLGNPINSQTTGAPPTNNGQTDPTEPVTNGRPPSMYETQPMDAADKEMWPNLSTGAINRILNGEDVPGPVFQILGCKKIPGIFNDRYRLLISDGITGCPFVMLGSQLGHMVTNKELEKFTIVRVDKCVLNQVQADRKVIILLSLTVLVPGNKVNEKLGNPINAPPSNNPAPTNKRQTAPTEPVTNDRPPSMYETQPMNGTVSVHPINTLTPYQNEWTIKARVTSKTPLRTDSNSRGEGKVFSVNLLDECGEIKATGFNDAADKKMWPNLSTGAINRILNGDDVPGPVFQIFGCKKIPGIGNDRYRLWISDGVASCPFVLLSSQLSHMVTNKELEKFTIVQVDKCVCNQVQADCKVIILLSLTVLVPGNKVNEKLGNPIITP
ncbi:hypothetical protein JTE90_015264 [Oedothorax gibbosus]|uniref:Replication factor-A protein 1 N-terminal domain-containing protein n=1 Tax=Oedothorax gibbosus TaxID=931172 RepID=A0AAV6UD20_9ARAC|nr:hypothetical protein JTE90_015264 [Oedothorax gibbosus]